MQAPVLAAKTGMKRGKVLATLVEEVVVCKERFVLQMVVVFTGVDILQSRLEYQLVWQSYNGIDGGVYGIALFVASIGKLMEAVGV